MDPTTFARIYNPNNAAHIAHLRTIDPTFVAMNKLAEHIRRPSALLLRCEAPYMHFVEFFSPEVIEWLPQCLHEIIDGTRPHRFYLDIEAKLMQNEVAALREKHGQFAGILPMFNHLVAKFAANFAGFVGQKGKAGYCGRRRPVINGVRTSTNYEASELAWSYQFYSHRTQADASGPVKFSCHIVFPHFVVANYEACKTVARAYSEYLTGLGFPRWIDLSIYKRVSSFRCPASSKRGETRPLINVRFADLPHLYTLDVCELVQFGELAPIIHVKYKETIQPNEMTQTALRDMRGHIFEKNAELLRGYSWDGVYDFSGRVLRLCCESGTKCLICGRAHSKTRGHHYVLNLPARAFFCCSHPDAKGKRPVRLETRSDTEEAREHRGALLKSLDIAEETLGSADYAEMVSTRFIGEEMARAFRGCSHLAVSSPMGTGKTCGLSQILLERGRGNVLMISMRKAFTLEKAGQLGLGHYMEERFADTIGLTGDIPSGVIIQAESLRRIESSYTPTLLICDEIESIFAQLAGVDSAAASTFNRLVRDSPNVIFMDANLTGNAVKYLAHVSNIRPRVLFNSFRHSGTAYIHSAPRTVWGGLVASALAGERVAYCTGSKGEIDELAEIIGEAIGHEKVLKATGETRESNAEAIREAGSAAALAERFQVVLYNTTWLAGISLDDSSRKKVYASFDKSFLSPPMAMQLLGRVRGVNEVHFYAKNAKTSQKYVHLLAKACGIVDFIGYDAAEVENTASHLSKCMARHLAAGERGRSEMRLSMLALLSRHGFGLMSCSSGPSIDIRGGLAGRRLIDAANTISEEQKRVAAELDAPRVAAERYAEAVERGEAGGKLVDDFRPIIHMPEWHYASKNIVADTYGIYHANIVKLTAAELAEMKTAASIERENNIRLLGGKWDAARLPKASEVFSAQNMQIAGALCAIRIMNILAPDCSEYVPSGEIAREEFAARIGLAAGAAGIIAPPTFEGQLKAINVRLAPFGIKYKSRRKKRIGGIPLATDFYAELCSSYEYRDGQCIHAAISRLQRIEEEEHRHTAEWAARELKAWREKAGTT